MPVPVDDDSVDNLGNPRYTGLILPSISSNTVYLEVISVPRCYFNFTLVSSGNYSYMKRLGIRETVLILRCFKAPPTFLLAAFIITPFWTWKDWLNQSKAYDFLSIGNLFGLRTNHILGLT